MRACKNEKKSRRNSFCIIIIKRKSFPFNYPILFKAQQVFSNSSRQHWQKKSIQNTKSWMINFFIACLKYSMLFGLGQFKLSFFLCSPCSFLSLFSFFFTYCGLKRFICWELRIKALFLEAPRRPMSSSTKAQRYLFLFLNSKR